MANYPSVDYFKDFLRKIYPCKEPFELLVVDKKPKRRAGSYIWEKHRIRIYAPWGHLKETAIHESSYSLYGMWLESSWRALPWATILGNLRSIDVCRSAKRPLCRRAN